MSIVQEIMIRSTDQLRRIIAPVGRTGRGHNVLFVSELQQFHLGRLHVVGLWEKEAQQLVVCDMKREIRLEASKQVFGRTNT